MNGQIFGVRAATAIITALLGWHIWRLFKPRDSWLDRPAVFFSIIFVAILVLRLPTIHYPNELNVDESQLVTQGKRYLSHPVPWRDVDGTTGGPLDSWLLSVPMFFGATASWATARTVLLAAQCATIFFIYLALRCFGTRLEAQLSLMPTIFFYAFTQYEEFSHYSSETLPVLLLSIMAWLLCRAWVAGKFPNGRLFFFGFLAGCVPFAKLQASPMAVYLAVVGLAVLAALSRRDGMTGKEDSRKAVLMCLGAAVCPVLLLGVVAVSGAGDDFLKSYIFAPTAYTHESLPAKIRLLWALFGLGGDFRSYFVSALAAGVLLAGAWGCVRKPKPGGALFWPLIATLGLGLVAAFCMMTAGKGFGHYLLLFIPAQGIFFGLALLVGKTLFSPTGADAHAFPKPVHFFLAGFAVVACLQIDKGPAYLRVTCAYLAGPRPEKKSFVAKQILRASLPGDTMSVWGWMPAYYVETGLMPATRDAICHFMIEEGPYRDYYCRRYLSDLRRNPPAIFVDAMGHGAFTYTWKMLSPHETFPELDDFIRNNYSLWSSVHFITDNGPGFPVRIYLRKPRMAELHWSPEEVNIPLD